VTSAIPSNGPMPLTDPRIVASVQHLTSLLMRESGGSGSISVKLHYHQGKFTGESIELCLGKNRVGP